jgi:DNA-binding Xre family transcriptional regulator
MLGIAHTLEVYTVRWKIRQLLEQHNITPYRLWKDSGLARQTVYTLAHDKGDRVDLGTLGAVLHTLEKLIGKPVRLDDVLEVVRDGA